MRQKMGRMEAKQGLLRIKIGKLQQGRGSEMIMESFKACLTLRKNVFLSNFLNARSALKRNIYKTWVILYLILRLIGLNKLIVNE